MNPEVMTYEQVVAYQQQHGEIEEIKAVAIRNEQRTKVAAPPSAWQKVKDYFGYGIYRGMA